MKPVPFAMITAIAFGAGLLNAAANTKKPVAEWTCADFLGVENTLRPKLIYWATAYSKAGKPESPMIDIEGTEKVIPIVTEDCERTPQDSF